MGRESDSQAGLRPVINRPGILKAKLVHSLWVGRCVKITGVAHVYMYIDIGTHVRSHFGSSRFGSRLLSISASPLGQPALVQLKSHVRPWQGLWQMGNMETGSTEPVAGRMVEQALGYTAGQKDLVGKPSQFVETKHMGVFKHELCIRMEQGRRQVLRQVRK